MASFNYKQNFNINNRTVIVTGATGILGRQYCHGFAQFGANVVVADLVQEQCSRLADELRSKYKADALGAECDVASPEAVSRMVALVVQEFGHIDILINNAASKSENLDEFFAPFEDYSLDEWRRVMSVNIDGMFLAAQAVGSQMIKQGTGGSIIQISSIYGIMAPDPRIYEGSYYLDHQINTPAVYSASKAAVLGLTRYLATYWADRGIRVNTLTPGGVQSGQNETFISKYSHRIPMGRMAYQNEMVGAALFLASDASSYVTGQNIVVDGGLSAW